MVDGTPVIYILPFDWQRVLMAQSFPPPVLVEQSHD